MHFTKLLTPPRSVRNYPCETRFYSLGVLTRGLSVLVRLNLNIGKVHNFIS